MKQQSILKSAPAPGRRKLALTLAATITLLVTLVCATVPITGRRQLSLVDEQELNSLAAGEYRKVISQSRLENHTARGQTVIRVGRRIQAAVERYFREEGESDYLQHYAWEFNVIADSKTANAWCMPGGKVAFYTGILPITADEKGVAVVMGHEIAHAIANHGNERMSQQAGLAKVTSIFGAGGQGIFQNLFGLAANVGVILPFSRANESEADRMGLIFMSMAGYDPDEAPRFWERMKKYTEGAGSPPQFLSTHPSHETRIKNLKEWIPEARKYYRPN